VAVFVGIEISAGVSRRACEVGTVCQPAANCVESATGLLAYGYARFCVEFAGRGWHRLACFSRCDTGSQTRATRCPPKKSRQAAVSGWQDLSVFVSDPADASDRRSGICQSVSVFVGTGVPAFRDPRRTMAAADRWLRSDSRLPNIKKRAHVSAAESGQNVCPFVSVHSELSRAESARVKPNLRP
jgi:hypothetical protein